MLKEKLENNEKETAPTKPKTKPNPTKTPRRSKPFKVPTRKPGTTPKPKGLGK